MNPFELLKKDHEKVSDLFERIEAVSGKAKLPIFKKIKNELEVHTHVEETIFYPALKNADETRDITLEAYEEHRVVKVLLAELDAAKPSDQWDAKLTVLKENVEHHVDEEENDLFKKAKDVLTTEQAEALGDEMASEKKRMGAPVSEEVAKPGLIKTVVNALFGSSAKKDTGKKSETTKSRRAKVTRMPAKKKQAAKKKAGSKKITNHAAKKATKSATKQPARKSVAKKTARRKAA